MTKNKLAAGLALTLQVFSASSLEAQKPGDGCSLLQASEIQALAGAAKVAAGKAGTDNALGSRTCEYEWGTGGNVQSGRSFFTISATPTSKLTRVMQTDCPLELEGHLTRRVRSYGSRWTADGKAAGPGRNAEPWRKRETDVPAFRTHTKLRGAPNLHERQRRTG